VGLQGEAGQARRLVKHKARLIVGGFIQCESIYFEEVFVSVACMESIHLLLALEVTKDYRVSPPGHEIGIPQWRARGDGLRQASSGLHHPKSRIQGATTM